MTYDYTIYIGRFQPFHDSHLSICKQALQQSKHLIILIGSSFAAPNIRNPFTFEQRRKMIEESLKHAGVTSFTIVPIKDHYYNDNNWIAEVQQKVAMIASPNSKIGLIGFEKDHTSYYLSLFPKWDLIEPKIEKLNIQYTLDGKQHQTDTLDASVIRRFYFESESFEDINILVPVVNTPPASYTFLKEFHSTEQFNRLQEEYRAIQAYNKIWESAPYEPTFVTSDAVVVCGGHILLVRRKGTPGKGLYALPGGFIQSYEKIQDSCLRELKEETRIKVPLPVLKGSIKEHKVFDHPLRSVRGRTITHAFYIQLDEKSLPKVKGSDDAEKAFWLPLSELPNTTELFFEDHAQIIESFIGRGI